MRMSREQAAWEKELARMDELCKDNCLSYDIYCETYPFAVEIGSMDVLQLSLDGEETMKLNVRYEFRGGELMVQAEKLKASNELQRKLENRVRRMYRAYLDMFFRENAVEVKLDDEENG